MSPERRGARCFDCPALDSRRRFVPNEASEVPLHVNAVHKVFARLTRDDSHDADHLQRVVAHYSDSDFIPLDVLFH